MNMDELLVECLDALNSYGESREEHCRLLQAALDTDEMTEKSRSALARLRTRLNSHVSNNPWSMFQTNEERLAFKQSIVQDLSSQNLPSYAYHGTIVKNLKGIAEDGLQPGRSPVWTGKADTSANVRANSDSEVFFSEGWREAMGMWAYTAHAKSRGPKNGVNRKPVVIRISRAKIALERDPLARNPSWMVKGSVSVQDAEVIIGFDVEFPQWVPLHIAAASLASK
jgi:hypothetical protein